MVYLSGYTLRHSACEGSSPYQLKMAAPAEVSKKNALTFEYDGIFHYTFNRAYCQNSVSDRQTDGQNDKPSTVIRTESACVESTTRHYNRGARGRPYVHPGRS